MSRYSPEAEALLPVKPAFFHILLSLARVDRHGYAIMQDVLDRTGGRIRLWPATLYGGLKKLMEDGLISESGDRRAETDDARRRYYRLTPFGREVLAAESERLEDLVRQLQAVRAPAAEPLR